MSGRPGAGLTTAATVRKPTGVELIAQTMEARANSDYRTAREFACQAVEAVDPRGDPELLVSALVELGRLHQDLGSYDEAARSFARAVADADLVADLSSRYSLRARALARLGGARRVQGHPGQAEPVLTEALALAGAVLRPSDPVASEVLVEAGGLQLDLGRYAEAERLFCRALGLAQTASGDIGGDRLRATALDALATAYRYQGRYHDADSLLQQALALAEAAFGPQALEVGNVLNDLAITYKFWGRFDEAEPLYRRALAIIETAVGADHPDVASLHHNLGGLAHARGDYLTAEIHARRSVAIRERIVPPDHPALAADRAALGAILGALRHDDEAEVLLRTAIAALDTTFGPDNHEVAAALHNLGGVLARRGEVDEAESCYRRALAIKERIEPESAGVAMTLNNLGLLCKRQTRYQEAESLYVRALAILEEVVEETHPALISCRANLAAVRRLIEYRDPAVATTDMHTRPPGAAAFRSPNDEATPQ